MSQRITHEQHNALHVALAETRRDGQSTQVAAVLHALDLEPPAPPAHIGVLADLYDPDRDAVAAAANTIVGTIEVGDDTGTRATAEVFSNAEALRGTTLHGFVIVPGSHPSPALVQAACAAVLRNAPDAPPAPDFAPAC